MRYPQRALCLAVVIALSLLGLIYAYASNPAPTTPQEFAELIQKIADTGLDDPEKIAEILGTKFSVEKKSYNQPPCPHLTEEPDFRTSGYAYKSSETDTYRAGPGFWYDVSPQGRPDLTFHPSLPGRPKSNIPTTPQLEFTVESTLACGGRHATKPLIETKLDFLNLPGFMFITFKDFKRFFPAAQDDRATDGAITYSIVGKASEDVGIWVLFNFSIDPNNSRYLTAIQIETDDRIGLRAKRISAKREACLADPLTSNLNKLDSNVCRSWPYLMEHEK